MSNQCNQKYEILTSPGYTRKYLGVPLYHIRALRDIPRYGVKVGDIGGWVKGDFNLSQEGDCWISGNGLVTDNGLVAGYGLVTDNGLVAGYGLVTDSGLVAGNGLVTDSGLVAGNGLVTDNGLVAGSGLVAGNGLVTDNGRVTGYGRVTDNGLVAGYGIVTDNGRVAGYGIVTDNGRVTGSGLVTDNGCAGGTSVISAQIRLYHTVTATPFTINSTDDYTFLYDPEKDMISAGRRYFTYDEAVRHWTDTRGGTALGTERLLIIKTLKEYAMMMKMIKM